MIKCALLLLLLFMMIFGPKISGWLDVLSIASLIPIALHFLVLNTSHIPTGVKRRTLVLLSVILLLLAYSCVHYFSQFDANPHQVLRFGRVFVNCLGVAALVSIYYGTFGTRTRDVLSRHVFHCLFLHALIMLAMFASPAFRHVIVNRVVHVDPDSRTYAAKDSGYRIAGLTDSWDALSGLESLGLLMLPVLLTRQPDFSRTYAAMSVPVLLFAVAISGRTGFVAIAALMPAALLFADLRRFHRTLAVAAIIAPLGVLLINGPLRNTVDRALFESSISRTLSIFGVASSTAQNESLQATIEGIQSHYFLPSEPEVLLLGTGGSGRDSRDYVPADNGPVLNLHNLGAFCFLLIYGSLVHMLVTGLALRRADPATAGFCVLAVALILMIDTKVLYVLARNGFSVMMVLVVMVWWEREFRFRHQSVDSVRMSGPVGFATRTAAVSMHTN